MYCTELTTEDRAAGFRLGEVAPGVRGVVRRFGDCDRVIKVEGPSGCVRYAHERYGNWDFQAPDDPPKWHLAFGEFACRPSDAVQLAAPRLAQPAALPIRPSVAP